jgi:hypothetical protein
MAQGEVLRVELRRGIDEAVPVGDLAPPERFQVASDGTSCWLSSSSSPKEPPRRGVGEPRNLVDLLVDLWPEEDAWQNLRPPRRSLPWATRAAENTRRNKHLLHHLLPCRRRWPPPGKARAEPAAAGLVSLRAGGGLLAGGGNRGGGRRLQLGSCGRLEEDARCSWSGRR